MSDHAQGRLDGVDDPRWLASWWLWAALTLAIFATAVLGVGLRPEGATIAVWWPAAGVSAFFLLASPRERRWLSFATILVVTFLANVAGGREVDISVVFGIANAAEAGIFVILLERGSQRFVLRTVNDSFRFIFAAAIGAITVGIVAGLGVYFFDDGSFLTTALRAFPSHAAAIMMIAPFAALPGGRADRVRWGETITQTVLLTASIVLIFGIDSQAPLGFVPLGLLAWGAFRLPTAITFVQSGATAIAVVLFSLAGRGPFAASQLTPDEQATAVVAYLLVLGAFVLVFVTAHTELSLATRRAANAAELLSSGFVDSEVGLALVTEREGVWQVAWANRAASTMLGNEVDSDGIWRGTLRDHAGEALANNELVTLAHPPRNATLNLVANIVARDTHRISVQIIDVTETLRATERQLDAERERAATLATRLELERQREDFLATTSHELRTPLMSISGYAELFRDTPELTDEHRQWIEIIERNAHRLTELIESMVIAGAPGEGTAGALTETFDAYELLHDLVAAHHARARGKNIEITLGETSGTVLATRGEIARALTSLFTNAIKFTPPGGVIHCEAVYADEHITITVADSGPGISPEAMPFVFDRFYRAPEAERDSTPGTGLGLSIAQQLMRRNGGTISLKTQPEGGLLATVRLPSTPAGISPSPTENPPV